MSITSAAYATPHQEAATTEPPVPTTTRGKAGGTSGVEKGKRLSPKEIDGRLAGALVDLDQALAELAEAAGTLKLEAPPASAIELMRLSNRLSRAYERAATWRAQRDQMERDRKSRQIQDIIDHILGADSPSQEALSSAMELVSRGAKPREILLALVPDSEASAKGRHQDGGDR